jgi:hypothetical protein
MARGNDAFDKPVMPAQAGIQGKRRDLRLWIPACAGMTRVTALVSQSRIRAVSLSKSVIPAQAGIQRAAARAVDPWIPACAGMTFEQNDVLGVQPAYLLLGAPVGGRIWQWPITIS